MKTMTKKLHVYTREVDEKIAAAKFAVTRLQEIYKGLIDLGAPSVSIDDVRNVVTADSNPGVSREIILRGRDLKIGGLSVDASFVKLPVDKIRQLAREAKKIDPGINLITWHYYDVEVICKECAAKEIAENFTPYGSAKAAELLVISRISRLINTVAEKIGINVGHPLRDLSTWVDWDNTDSKFTVNVSHIANHLK